MHGLDLLHDLAAVILIAGIVTILCHRFKQPVALGYIVAGIIVGPYTPIQFVNDADTVRGLGDLGVVLLMFSLGLEFSLRKLTRVGLRPGPSCLNEGAGSAAAKPLYKFRLLSLP